jgi:hypothetical protein
VVKDLPESESKVEAKWQRKDEAKHTKCQGNTLFGELLAPLCIINVRHKSLNDTKGRVDSK